MTSGFVHGNGIDIHYRIAGEASGRLDVGDVGEDLGRGLALDAREPGQQPVGSEELPERAPVLEGPVGQFALGRPAAGEQQILP